MSVQSLYKPWGPSLLLAGYPHDAFVIKGTAGRFLVGGVQPNSAGRQKPLRTQAEFAVEFQALVAGFAVLGKHISRGGVGERAFHSKQRGAGRPIIRFGLCPKFHLFAHTRRKDLIGVGRGGWRRCPCSRAST